jgi:N-acylneuraminate cytidylyltransferase
MPIALIPARVHSHGIPNKNFRPLVGISPVMRAVTACFGAGIKAYVSSDRPNLEHWRWWVERPAELAKDTTPMRLVIEHFLQQVDGPPDELILLVEPTQPLRQPKHLTQAIELSEQYPRVVSVVETESVQKLYFVTDADDVLLPVSIPVERRQDARKTYRCDGTVYTFRRKAFPALTSLQRGSHLILIPPEESCPLDTPLDWQLAELRLSRGQRGCPPAPTS